MQKSIEILEQLSQSGHANSAELSMLYLNGDGKRGHSKNLETWLIEHRSGSCAGYLLHDIYYWGFGTLADDKLSLKYLEEAAERVTANQ